MRRHRWRKAQDEAAFLRALGTSASGIDVEARVKACWALGYSGDRRALPVLLRLLRTETTEVAQAAAFALGPLGSRQAVPALIRALRGARAWEVRYAAAMGLRDIHDPRSTPPLIEALRSPGEHPEVRGQAAEALHSWGQPEEVVAALVEGLGDPEPVVRFWCAFALSQCGGEAEVPALQKLLDDPAMVPRWRTVGDEAGWALNTIQNRRGWGSAQDCCELADWVPVRYRDFEMYTTDSMSEYRKTPIAAEALRRAGVDALLLTPGADLFYLTGFEHTHAGERLLALFLRSDGSFTWIAPAMNAAQIDAHGLAGGALRAWTDAETYLPALREATEGTGSLAFDDEARAAFLMDLQELRPRLRISKSGAITRTLRMRKDAGELTAMRAAARTVDETIPEAIALCAPGRSEQEIESRLRAALLKRFPESAVAFIIVAGGENSAYPHHETERRRLKQGDVVILDFGTRREGYHSDITVTCAVGEPADPEVRKVYRVVWEAQQKALEAIRPGVPCEAVDRAAREHISAAGYGQYFLHRTGHGLGLQVHEPPYIVAGNAEVLEEGMVFSIEPGIYLPDRFGVRLEVIGSVGADGVSLINAPSARDLPIAGER
jgi:Xaa-Pro aminopeptidase